MFEAKDAAQFHQMNNLAWSLSVYIANIYFLILQHFWYWSLSRIEKTYRFKSICQYYHYNLQLYISIWDLIHINPYLFL